MKYTYRILILFLILQLFTFSQWEQTSGPGGAIIYSILIDGADIYIGVALDGFGIGGVYRSSDMGENWFAVNNGLNNKSVQTVVVSGSYLLAGTTSDGVFRSVNGGESWSPVNGGLGNLNIKALATNESALFAGTTGGIFRSENNGESWVGVNAGVGNSDVRSIAVMDNKIFAATFGGGVFLSSDNGDTWVSANNGLTNLNVRVLTVNGSALYAGTNNGLFSTADNGMNWNLLSIGTLTSIITAITVNPNHPGDIFTAVQSFGIYRSMDQGISWTDASNGMFSRENITSIAVKNEYIFAATQGGIYRSAGSDDVWTEKNNGLRNAWVRALLGARDGSGSIFAGTNHNGIFVSQDNGTTWGSMNAGLLNTTAVGNFPPAVYDFDALESTLFAATSHGVYRYSDATTGWVRKVVGMTNTFVNAIAVIPYQSSTLLAGTHSGGVFRSTDSGETWYAVDDGVTKDRILSFLVDPRGNIFAGSTVGGIFYSSDVGSGWADRSIAQSTGNVVVFASLNDLVFAGTDGDGMYRSPDVGLNWIKVPTPAGTSSIRDIAIVGNGIFAATAQGVILSTDGGESWSFVNEGLVWMESFPQSVFSLCTATDNSATLLAGTMGSSVWKRPLSDMITSVESITADIHPVYRLHQNYPNPFNPTTTIRFEIPHDGFVSLKIFDILGREVAVVVSEPLSAGFYSYDWESGERASGPYIYRLEAGDFVAAKKLILLR